jgi:predicted O-methyltransferase YrrM
VTSLLNQIEIGQFSLYFSDARDILPAFLTGAQEVICINPSSLVKDIPKKKFDFIFIDGAFRMTREFFDFSRPLLSDN